VLQQFSSSEKNCVPTNCRKRTRGSHQNETRFEQFYPGPSTDRKIKSRHRDHPPATEQHTAIITVAINIIVVQEAHHHRPHSTRGKDRSER
jgi:hypothetical protein